MCTLYSDSPGASISPVSTDLVHRWATPSCSTVRPHIQGCSSCGCLSSAHKVSERGRSQALEHNKPLQNLKIRSGRSGETLTFNCCITNHDHNCKPSVRQLPANPNRSAHKLILPHTSAVTAVSASHCMDSNAILDVTKICQEPFNKL